MASFSGEPKTVWSTEHGRDRRMTLLEDFWFVDRAQARWDAPKGSVVDGATIPRPLWALVGSPYTGDYRRASVVHDIACDNAETSADRRKADRMFFEACRAGGCSLWDSIVLYVGVRVGAWWGSVSLLDDRPARLELAPDERELIRDFQEIAQTVLSQGESDDPAIVEGRVDDAMQSLVARKMAAAALASQSIR